MRIYKTTPDEPSAELIVQGWMVGLVLYPGIDNQKANATKSQAVGFTPA